MPLYEYQCPKCEKVHEIMQKFSDPLVTECPDCSGPVTKLISLSSFALKGSGWYTTDYKAKSGKPVGEKPGDKKEGEGAKSTGTGESASVSKPKDSSAGSESKATPAVAAPSASSSSSKSS